MAWSSTKLACCGSLPNTLSLANCQVVGTNHLRSPVCAETQQFLPFIDPFCLLFSSRACMAMMSFCCFTHEESGDGHVVRKRNRFFFGLFVGRWLGVLPFGLVGATAGHWNALETPRRLGLSRQSKGEEKGVQEGEGQNGLQCRRDSAEVGEEGN